MRRALAVASVVATSVAAGVFGFVGTASADPSADDWYQLRMCESTNQYDINTGNGYYGAYQFDQSTWNSVGGSGRPDQASPEEQDYRALLLYRQRGWEPWVCARIVGLSEDGDAGSGVAPPVPGNQGGGGGGSEGSDPGGSGGSDSGSGDSGGGEATGGAPAWPGRTYSQGDYSEDLKTWQKQMGSRGYDLVGTGYFGPKTEAAVLDLQAKAGLNVVGYIGPKTWAAAWSSSAAGGGSDSSGGGSSSGGGYTPATPESCGVGAASAPAWPGRQFVEGDTDAALQCFQKQLATRGYGLIGTGYYGPNTKAAVVDFQSKQGINPSGIVGPKTWAAAWEG